jgi:hypothetical protein
MSKSLSIPFPLKGITRNWPQNRQPEGTTPAMQNVYVRDQVSGRLRGAQRPGVSKFRDTELAGAVSALLQVSASDTGEASGRTVYLVVAAGGTLYTAEGTGALTSRATGLGTSVSLAAIGTDVYIANGGTNIQVLDLTDYSLANLTATAGSAPTDVTLLTVWRGRLIAVRGDDDPHNVYASASGDPTDWEYAPDVLNATQAFVLNAGTQGQIGRAIRAVCPWKEDMLVVGTDSGIFALRGDPADGGSVVSITEAVGISKAYGWCVDPMGSMWFYGSGGIYRLQPDGIPQPAITDRVRDWLMEHSIARYNVQLRWDAARGGFWMFATPLLEADKPGKHLFYDATADAVEFHQFPSAHGPTASLVYDGDGLRDRYVLLGGEDGYIRKLDPDATSDDGTAISSYVDVALTRPAGDGQQAILAETDLVLATGSGTTNVTLEVRVGDDAEAARLASAGISTAITAGGRRAKLRTRLRGETFVFRLTNSTLDKTWSFEKLTAAFAAGGKI